jgi:hypothetical protein
MAVLVLPDRHLAARPGYRGALLVAVVDPPPLDRFGVLRI